MAVDMVKYRSDFVPVRYGYGVQAAFPATTTGVLGYGNRYGKSRFLNRQSRRTRPQTEP